MANQQPPLSYVASGHTMHPQISSTVPPEVMTCLKNARFLHLATCDDRTPHISLMNYTYLPSTPYSSSPTIIMTMNPSSKKTFNLTANPRVSLLVHDWVSHRPPTRTADPTRDGSPPPRTARSSLATMLLSINTSALSRISTTIDGDARVVDQGTEEEKWLKEMHLENNNFGDDEEAASLFGMSPADPNADSGRAAFIEGEEVRVVVVKIESGRIADWKGNVQDWRIRSDAESRPMVNGV